MLTDSVSQELGDDLSLLHDTSAGMWAQWLGTGIILKAPSLTPGAWARMIQR